MADSEHDMATILNAHLADLLQQVIDKAGAGVLSGYSLSSMGLPVPQEISSPQVPEPEGGEPGAYLGYLENLSSEALPRVIFPELDI